MRVAHGAGALGAPRGGQLPADRRRRRAPHPQRRERRLPLGTAHPRARRCCRARAASPARSTTCGSTPTPTRCDRELRTQIERALAWGIDVTHLAPHLSAITLRPEFFDIYIGLAVDFALPVRLPSTITAEQAGFPFRKLAADEGVVFPDHFDHDWRPGSRDRVTQTLANLPAGVTEIHIQPAIDSPEVRGFSAAAEAWIDDLALALDPALPAQLDAAGATTIGYRELRGAMRAG